MVRFFPFLFVLLLQATFLKAQKPNEKETTPNTVVSPSKMDMPGEILYIEPVKVEWNETAHNFGTVTHNIPVTCVFEFTNKGKNDIALADVQRSCGCTTPDWNQDPVRPGKKGKVTATYNSGGIGPFSKTITVRFNDGTTVNLSISGVVEPDKNAVPVIPTNPEG